MRRVPWHLSWRLNRKGAVTTLGIALAVTFAFASFSVARALEQDTLGIARSHPGTAFVVVSPDGEPFAFDRLDEFPAAVGVVLGEGRDPGGRAVVLIALVERDLALQPGFAHPSTADTPAVDITTTSGKLAGGDRIAHALVPPGWYLVAPGELGANNGLVEHAILPGASPEDVARLEALGLEAHTAPALRSFFRASGVEIARDLVLVVAFTSSLGALFCYEFLRSEVRESRREIGIWRAVGMGARDVVLIFLARALAMGAAALVIGQLAAVAALALTQRATGAEALALAVDVRQAIALSVVFLAAVLVGGILPALAAGRIQVQGALESAP